VTGLSGNNIVSIEVRHLYADNGVAELARIPLTSLPESILLGDEATMIIRFKLDAAVTIDELSDETKHFAATMLQPISANSTVSFDVDGLTPGTHGEAILRLGIGRSHGLSLNPDVAINGTPVSVATDYRGYDQFHNGQGQPRFFGVLEIPVPWSAIASDNQVDVTFPDNGGYVSSVALQVFDQSVAVTRRSN
jgi:agarase